MLGSSPDRRFEAAPSLPGHTGGGRRTGDDPFLTDDDLFNWLPRALALVAVALAVLLLLTSFGHRNDYRLINRDGAAVLERGRFSPWGFEAEVPEGAEEAFALPVPVPGKSGEEIADGDLEEVVEVLAERLQKAYGASVNRQDPAEIEGRQAQIAALKAWMEAEGLGSTSALAWGAAAESGAGSGDAGRALPAPAAGGQGQRWGGDPAAAPGSWSARGDQRRSYNASRRALLQHAEQMLDDLPPLGQGSPEQARDRQALQAFIVAMDTPAR